MQYKHRVAREPEKISEWERAKNPELGKKDNAKPYKRHTRENDDREEKTTINYMNEFIESFFSRSVFLFHFILSLIHSL